MIGYTCKYAPVELLHALGTEPVLLRSEAGSTHLAESRLHNNVCSYIKAVMQQVAHMELRELVLVDCCDSHRRLFDVLRGEIPFLFLLSLPHRRDAASAAMFKGELLRLVREYGEYKGESLDMSEMSLVFEDKEPNIPDGPCIGLMGARCSEQLFGTIEAHLSLPVADLTCGGHRDVAAPPRTLAIEEQIGAYAANLLGQTPCLRMMDVAGRDRLLEVPGMKGIIYHTLSFCDYYPFEFEQVRKNTSLPLLKIESDFTPLSRGQLSTRLAAFAEGFVPAVQAEFARKTGTARAGEYFAGIDSGSTSTNIVVLDREGSIRASTTVRTGPRVQAGAEKALAAVADQGVPRAAIARLITTGYGRGSISSDGAVTEITCHARGAFHQRPGIATVIDIGGQDSKVICLEEDGRVRGFVMNDKCAAGTGRFLEMMARCMEMELAEMSGRGLTWREDLTISSMCTVFAESEVVSLIAESKQEDDIIHGINKAVAAKTHTLAHRAGGAPAYMMTGGVAANRGVVEALEERLGAPLWIPPRPELCGALGAALFALEG